MLDVDHSHGLPLDSNHLVVSHNPMTDPSRSIETSHLKWCSIESTELTVIVDHPGVAIGVVQPRPSSLISPSHQRQFQVHLAQTSPFDCNDVLPFHYWLVIIPECAPLLDILLKEHAITSAWEELSEDELKQSN